MGNSFESARRVGASGNYYQLQRGAIESAQELEEYQTGSVSPRLERRVKQLGHAVKSIDSPRSVVLRASDSEAWRINRESIISSVRAHKRYKRG